MTKLLFFPIEIKSRELMPRLLMSLFALKKNYYCFVGSKQGIFRATRHFSPGNYFYKSINHTDLSHIKKIKNLKNNYFVLDEEGGFQYSSSKEINKFITYRSSLKNVEKIDKFFTWGKFDYTEWKKRYSIYKNKFILSGSPRIDFWKHSIIKKIYKNELIEIKKNFDKNTILIISSFVTSEKEIKKSMRNYEHWHKFKNNKARIKQFKQRKSDLALLKKFLKLINFLSTKNPNYKFVIRPHPSENINDWKKFVKKMGKNIFVTKEFDVTPWIYSSKYVIHNSSAVGLQTAGMKKNLITYRPKGFIYDRNFTNKFGYVVNTVNKVQNIINSNQNYKKIQTKNFKKLKNRFFYIDQNKFVSEKLIHEINKNNNLKSKCDFIKLYFFSYVYKIKDLIFMVLQKFIKIKDKKLPTLRSSSEKLSGGIKKDEIFRFFKSMNNYNLDVKIIKFCNNCYFIYRKN